MVAMASDWATTQATSEGRDSISRAKRMPSSREKRRPRPSLRAIMRRTATWQVKALVEATEISGPAWR